MASTRDNPSIANFRITTSGELNDLDVVGSEISEDQLELMLARPGGVIYAYNQDQVLVEFMFDMDGESIVATPVVLKNGNAVDHPAVARVG